jgi:hypothetical protein
MSTCLYVAVIQSRKISTVGIACCLRVTLPTECVSRIRSFDLEKGDCDSLLLLSYRPRPSSIPIDLTRRATLQARS